MLCWVVRAVAARQLNRNLFRSPGPAAGALPAPLPRTGVVLKVNSAARTAVVAWLEQAASGALQPLQPGEAGETVSVYSIMVRPCERQCNWLEVNVYHQIEGYFYAATAYVRMASFHSRSPKAERL